MPIIDTHCHLDLIEGLIGKNGLINEIKKANDYGISKFITIATSLENSINLQKLFSGSYNINTTVGIHPDEIINANSKVIEEEILKKLEKTAKEHKVVAIGEIGLDIVKETTDEEIKNQEHWFKKQIELAILVNKPIIIHCRNAFQKCFEILQHYNNLIPNIIFHCFTGSKNESRYLIDKFNAKLSFSGILTFKNASQIREAAQYTPVNNILVETDAPYLAPDPYRGKRNELYMINYTAKKLADIKSIELEELEYYTYNNAYKVFNL